MNDLFNNDDIAVAVEAIANPIEHLVGEGKKYKTPEQLAKGKLYSDLFIDKQKVVIDEQASKLAQLEAELAQMRETSKKTVEEINREGITNNLAEGKTAQMFTLEDVKKIVGETLSSSKDAETRQRNVEMVRETLQKTWGDKYQAKLEEAAKEFGGKEELARMAETNPRAFLKLVDANGEPKAANTNQTNAALFNPNSSIQIGALTNKGQGTVKGHKYFQELRKSDPKNYFSGPAFQERMASIAALGEDYYKH